LYDLSLDPGKSSRVAECLPIGLEAGTSLAVSAEISYASDAKAGLRLHVRGSEDGVNCDTEDLYTFDVPCKAGAKVKKTFQMNPSVRFAKVVVENLDKSSKAASVTITATVGN